MRVNFRTFCVRLYFAPATIFAVSGDLAGGVAPGIVPDCARLWRLDLGHQEA